MIVTENILLALHSLMANKMRALLTMLGIIIGISAVISIMTVGNSLTKSVSVSMESMGAGNIQVGLEPRDWEKYSAMSDAQKADLENYFTIQMLEKFIHRNGDKIKAIAVTQAGGSGKAKVGNSRAGLDIAGVNAGFFIANKKTLLAGRSFEKRDYEEGKAVALISDKTADKLYGGNREKALGKQIEVNVENQFFSYTIIGIYKFDNSQAGQEMNREKEKNTPLYVPVKNVMRQTKAAGYESFTIVTAEGVTAPDFTQSIQKSLNSYFEKKNMFTVYAYSMEAMAAEMTKMISTITLAISVIAGIALLVGGIGVMNIMMVSITERTREIGTRKALGAANGSIRLQFIVEAVLICLTGGLIGIVLGIILGSAASMMLGYKASATAGSIFLSLGFSMAIGVFFGFYPANKAAKMNPIDALRYE